MKLKLHLVFRTNNRFYFYSTNILLTSKSRENHIKSGYCAFGSCKADASHCAFGSPSLQCGSPSYRVCMGRLVVEMGWLRILVFERRDCSDSHGAARANACVVIVIPSETPDGIEVGRIRLNGWASVLLILEDLGKLDLNANVANDCSRCLDASHWAWRSTFYCKAKSLFEMNLLVRN